MGRRAGRETVIDDSDEPSAGRQALEGVPDMGGGFAGVVAAGQPFCEGRVHQNDGGALGVAQEIVDLGGVFAVNVCVEQRFEGVGAVGVDLVEDEARAANTGKSGERAMTGRRLQHQVAGANLGGKEGGVGVRRGRGELLQRDAVFGPEPIGRLQGRHGVEPFERRRRIGGDERLADLQEMAGFGGFGGIIGILPSPCALGVRPAIGRGHRLTKFGAGDALRIGDAVGDEARGLHTGIGRCQRVSRALRRCGVRPGRRVFGKR